MTPLRDAREKAGLTVEELADMAGVSTSIITLRERTRRGSVKLSTARALAKALETTVDELWPIEEGK